MNRPITTLTRLAAVALCATGCGALDSWPKFFGFYNQKVRPT